MCLGDKTHNPHTTLNHHVGPFAGCKKETLQEALWYCFIHTLFYIKHAGKNVREEDHHTPNTRPHRSYRLFEKDRVYTIQEFFQIPRYIL
jgi:hypothetical protein